MRLEHGNGASRELGTGSGDLTGFINASVKHHTRSTFVSLFEGAHGNAATSTKLSLAQS